MIDDRQKEASLPPRGRPRSGILSPSGETAPPCFHSFKEASWLKSKSAVSLGVGLKRFGSWSATSERLPTGYRRSPSRSWRLGPPEVRLATSEPAPSRAVGAGRNTTRPFGRGLHLHVRRYRGSASDNELREHDRLARPGRRNRHGVDVPIRPPSRTGGGARGHAQGNLQSRHRPGRATLRRVITGDCHAQVSVPVLCPNESVSTPIDCNIVTNRLLSGAFSAPPCTMCCP